MHKFNPFLFLFLSFIWAGCPGPAKEKTEDKNNLREETQISSDTPQQKTVKKPGALEKSLIESGLINIQELDSGILVSLKYSTTDNFVGVDVYGDLENAYLQEGPARKLINAQAYLKEKYPGHSLLVYDAVRPRQVQQILWDTLQMPEQQKPKYVANPQVGSIHNYGAAVDLTIADKNGIPLDMGTAYDYFGKLAYPTLEQEMLESGKLTERQVKNRELLRGVMGKAGFSPITTEWWHFNAMSRKKAAGLYGIVE